MASKRLLAVLLLVALVGAHASSSRVLKAKTKVHARDSNDFTSLDKDGSLGKNAAIKSPNGQYQLLNNVGSIALYKGNNQLWAEKVSDQVVLVQNDDGTLGSAFYSECAGDGDYELRLYNDGTLVVLNGDGDIVWRPPTTFVGSVQTDHLLVSDTLQSPDGQISFNLQTGFFGPNYEQTDFDYWQPTCVVVLDNGSIQTWTGAWMGNAGHYTLNAEKANAHGPFTFAIDNEGRVTMTSADGTLLWNETPYRQPLSEIKAPAMLWWNWGMSNEWDGQLEDDMAFQRYGFAVSTFLHLQRIYRWGYQSIWEPNIVNEMQYLYFSTDGVLTVYGQGGQQLWSSKTQTINFGHGPYKLSLNGDGALILSDSSNTPIWWRNREFSVAVSPAKLRGGDRVVSPNGIYGVYIHDDTGIFELYKQDLSNNDYSSNRQALWRNDYPTAAKTYLHLENNGNLSVKRVTNEVHWSTKTKGQGHAPYSLKVTDDPLVQWVDSKGKVLWSQGPIDNVPDMPAAPEFIGGGDD